jgi:hypothetical protein
VTKAQRATQTLKAVNDAHDRYSWASTAFGVALIALAFLKPLEGMPFYFATIGGAACVPWIKNGVIDAVTRLAPYLPMLKSPPKAADPPPFDFKKPDPPMSED